MKLIEDPKCLDFRERFPEEFLSYGCGPGRIGDWLVSDKILGLSIREACRRHDWGYRHSPERSEEDRKKHDIIFKKNCKIIVNARSKSKILKHLRIIYSNAMYVFIRLFGRKSYWEEG